MESSLKQKVDEYLESFVVKMKPRNGQYFTYSELMPLYKQSLQQFSELAYQELNEPFINEQINELESNITPTVRKTTDGTDEIIGSIATIEVAKIIFSHGVNDDKYERKINRPELDDANEAIYRSMRYLFTKNGNASKIIYNKLGKYIYRNNTKDSVGQNSGCIVFLLFVITSISSFFVLLIK